MIALAAADWPLTRQLRATNTLPVDYLETAGPLTDSAVRTFPDQPMLLHNSVFNWSLGHPDALAQQDVLLHTQRRLQATRAPWLSVHLGFSAADISFDGWTRAHSAPFDRDILMTTICQNLACLMHALPVPVLVENLDYNPGGAYEHICEPGFITAVVERTGAGLLLDLAHARVSAARMRMPIERYLAALPLDQVVQLHISSPRWRDGRLADAHEHLLEDDYRLLQTVLDTTQPRAITLEYHRDAARLHAQLARLRRMLATDPQA
jgi:uncharacterized protein (UPF0276 family)